MLADFAFFMGDLNYRLKTTFSELNNSNVNEIAIDLAATQDQMLDAFSQGNFPDYIEPRIDFLPSYKMSSESQEYINKKE